MSEPEQKGRFAPKQPVELAAPKDDPITLEHLAKCDGKPPHWPVNQRTLTYTFRHKRGVSYLCRHQSKFSVLKGMG